MECARDVKKRGKSVVHDGTRTRNLPLRRRMPYPIGPRRHYILHSHYTIPYNLCTTSMHFPQSPPPTIPHSHQLVSTTSYILLQHITPATLYSIPHRYNSTASY